MQKITENALKWSLGGLLGGLRRQLGFSGRPRVKKEGPGDEKPIHFGDDFRIVGQRFGVLFLSVFGEPFLKVFFRILVPKGIPTGDLWGSFGRLLRTF